SEDRFFVFPLAAERNGLFHSSCSEEKIVRGRLPTGGRSPLDRGVGQLATHPYQAQNSPAGESAMLPVVACAGLLFPGRDRGCDSYWRWGHLPRSDGRRWQSAHA